MLMLWDMRYMFDFCNAELAVGQCQILVRFETNYISQGNMLVINISCSILLLMIGTASPQQSLATSLAQHALDIYLIVLAHSITGSLCLTFRKNGPPTLGILTAINAVH